MASYGVSRHPLLIFKFSIIHVVDCIFQNGCNELSHLPGASDNTLPHRWGVSIPLFLDLSGPMITAKVKLCDFPE